LQERQRALVLANVVENALNEAGRIEAEPDLPGRRDDGVLDLSARHGSEQNLPGWQKRPQFLMRDQRIVEIRPHCCDDGDRGGSRGRQKQVDETVDVAGALAGAPLIAEPLRVEFLPLVDIEQQSIRLSLRASEFLADHVGQQLGIARS